MHGGGVPAEGPPSGDPSKRAGACSIGFSVENVDNTYEELKAKGIRFVMPPTRQVDSDGLPVSFAQAIA
ncbi:MAG TPA: VOC family protein [Pyrinomonadaceae bacterium]|nr:VOC family protein [Pyrinomonadaceae bacterium]